MKIVSFLILVALLCSCAEQPQKTIPLQSSRVIPLSGKAILFNHKK